jgi:hypothetical protein
MSTSIKYLFIISTRELKENRLLSSSRKHVFQSIFYFDICTPEKFKASFVSLFIDQKQFIFFIKKNNTVELLFL